jgi:hypothetical protein
MLNLVDIKHCRNAVRIQQPSHIIHMNLTIDKVIVNLHVLNRLPGDMVMQKAETIRKINAGFPPFLVFSTET